LWDLLDVEEELQLLAAERRRRPRPPNHPVFFGEMPPPEHGANAYTLLAGPPNHPVFFGEALVVVEVMPPDLSEEEALVLEICPRGK
jgi:hypothetical protein